MVRLLPGTLAALVAISTPATASPRALSIAGIGCEAHTQEAVFVALFPDLALEDFEDSNVAQGHDTGCADPVDSSGDGGVCFDPGDIEVGLTIESTQAPSANGLVLDAGGLGGDWTGRVLLQAFSDQQLELVFSPPVSQVGLRLYGFDFFALGLDVTAEIEVYAPGGALVGTFTTPAAAGGSFWGIACEGSIEEIRIDAVQGGGGFRYAAADDIRFGTSEADLELGTRYCSPNLPNSTGESGLMIVTGSAIDADDDLELIALRLPTNGNIGYFLMGTGTSSFIPTGASSFLCVAPGLKRYLPPVNSTSQFPGGFDRVVGTQGNGHPVSASITPGSTWNFQAWHRDSNAGTSHFTDAVSVTFQ